MSDCAAILCVLAMAASGAATTFDAAELTEAESIQLQNNQAVARVARDENRPRDAALVFGAVDIDAAPQDIWPIMLDCDRAVDIVPHLKSCTILETAADGSSDVREHVVSYTFLFPNVRSVFRSTYRPFEEIRIERVSGDFRILEGVWRIAPLEERVHSRVTYQARIAIGTPAPRALIRAGLRKDMAKVLTALKETIEVDGEP